MAVGMYMAIPGGDADFYDSVMDHLEWDTKPLPAGFVSHYAGPSPDGGWFIFDVWDSQQDFENFAQERLKGAVGAATGGEAPDLQPQFIPIHRQAHA
jgi:hypothetical protein